MPRSGCDRRDCKQTDNLEFEGGLPPTIKVRRLVLTGEEKKVILFVLVALLVGLGVKLYRARKQHAPPARMHAVASLTSHADLRGGRVRSPDLGGFW
jgi:hypothetical protein